MDISFLFRCLGGRLSFSARQKDRLNMSFESMENAQIRVEEEQHAEQAGLRKKKNHARVYKNIQWDIKGLRIEIEGLPDGHKIN